MKTSSILVPTFPHDIIVEKGPLAWHGMEQCSSMECEATQNRSRFGKHHTEQRIFERANPTSSLPWLKRQSKFVSESAETLRTCTGDMYVSGCCIILYRCTNYRYWIIYTQINGSQPV